MQKIKIVCIIDDDPIILDINMPIMNGMNNV